MDHRPEEEWRLLAKDRDWEGLYELTHRGDLSLSDLLKLRDLVDPVVPEIIGEIGLRKDIRKIELDEIPQPEASDFSNGKAAQIRYENTKWATVLYHQVSGLIQSEREQQAVGKEPDFVADIETSALDRLKANNTNLEDKVERGSPDWHAQQAIKYVQNVRFAHAGIHEPGIEAELIEEYSGHFYGGLELGFALVRHCLTSALMGPNSGI
ncbi:hypothetical protein [Candidatus Halocynthiibacter alkanivorans]|uniref:hypothetical protein n=1 Tax=Candidatus Halocynthiibacter alkanivorans TaxID=2267619 RepID=UPI000DF162C9|nr:hypothetical protein [Candidatus Halocynthiibacter alkanivorans]